MKMQVSVPPRSNEPDDSESLPFGPRTHKGAVLKLAMQELSLSGDILPVGARLLVRHTFVSAERIPMEVVYSFMLPRDAALRRFRIEGKGFSVKSKLLPTSEAKRFYEDGIMEGHLSSLAQVYRDGMVNLTVGNIRPGEQVSVIMEILAGVELRDDSLRFRFPFTLAPAYHPKARMSLTADRSGEIQLPEDEFGDLILPPFRPDADKLHRIGFDLKVFAPAGLSELGSPSHAIHVSETNGTAARVQLALDHDVPNRDLVLEARFKTNYTGILVGTGKGSKRPFVGIVSSQAFGRTQVRPPRQLVFLLDRSGSMEGEPITQARNAILACLGALRATDRIGLVAFDDETEVFKSCLVVADRSARAAFRAFLEKVDARGGTKLVAGLKRAAELLAETGGDIFLVTDGQVFDTGRIIDEVKRLGVSIHVLGIGSASQDRFLTLLARETGGISRFTTPRERVDAAAMELFAAVAPPVAAKIKIGAEGNGALISPEPARKTYDTYPVVVWGEIGPGEACLVVKAEAVNREVVVVFPPDAAYPAETLRLLRGARLITDLEIQLEREGEEPEPGSGHGKSTRLSVALEKVSREYGLASRMMSLVAVVDRKGDVSGKMPMTSVVPVGMPQDIEMGAYFTGSPMMSCFMDEPRFMTSDFKESCEPSFMSQDMKRKAMAKAPQDVTGMDLAVQLAGAIEADGGMPGRDEQQRLAASLIAILTLIDLWVRDGVGPFHAQLERLVEYVKASKSRLPLARGMIAGKVCQMATTFLDSPGTTDPAPEPWDEVARMCVLRKRSGADRGWRELERRFSGEIGAVYYE